jgi:hypothetical protein
MLGDLADGGYANLPFVGQRYFLDPTNGADANDGTTPATAFKTLTAAYAALTDGQHDTLFYISGSSGITLTAAFTWGKSYTHFVGVCSPTVQNQRSRIFQTADLDLSPLITISGSGCVWKNIYISQEANDAHSLIAVKVTGARNYFENCHFAGGGHSACAISGGTNLLLDGAEENAFVNCTIGRDTIADATGWAGLVLDTVALRNTFRRCQFLMYAGATTAFFVKVADSSAIDRYHSFEDCKFLNTCRTYSLVSAFSIPTSLTSVTNFLVLDNCWALGVDDWDSSNRGVMYLAQGTITAGGNTGLMQASNAT